jgi:hypothetical protein
MNETVMRSLDEQRQQVAKIADATMQGAARMLEIQASAARAFLEGQSRTVSLFRAPDAASLFKATDPPMDAFAASTRQMLGFMQQASETISQVQRQLSQMMEAQTSWMTEQMKQSMDEFSRQATENMQKWSETVAAMSDTQRSAEAAKPHSEEPTIVVSGLEGTRSGQRQEERGKATAKR